MTGVAIKGLLGRKLRTVLTALAIILGVAMISGTYILTDTITGAFTSIVDKSYENSDAVISGKVAFKNTNSNTQQTPAFPAAVLTKVRQLPQTGSAAGVITDEAHLVGRDGKIIASGGSPPIAYSVDAAGDQRFNPLTLSTGKWPVGNGQIAIDENTATTKHFAVGDSIGVSTVDGLRSFAITGVAKFASVSSIGGATIAIFDLPTAQQLFHKQGKLDEIQVAASKGVAPDQLASAIKPLLPPTAKVETSQAKKTSQIDDINKSTGVVQKFLLGFGFIALFVGSFVIANTLSITIAQRVREFATLRTIGGSRRQVLRVVMLEAFVVGVIASILGLVLGLGLAKGLNALFKALGVEFPAGGTVVATRTIVVSILAGVIVTLLASLRPAIKATRVPPIAAVREGATLPPSKHARFGAVASVLTLALGIVLLVYGVFGSGPTATRLLALGVGVLVLFIGVSLNAKRAVRPLALVLGWPGARIGGTAGRLARENALRNPSRTASTASALMIGLALITFVAILGSGLRSSFGDAVDKLFVADYALTASNGFDPFVKQADDAAALTPGVTAVSPIRGGDARIFDKNVQVTAVSPNLAQTVRIDWLEGGSGRAGQPRQGWCFHGQGLCEEASPDNRLADRSRHTDRTDSPPPPEGHLRSTQGWLAVRPCDDVHCDLRRQLFEAAELHDADQHEGRRERRKHVASEHLAELVPRLEDPDCRAVQEDPGGRHQQASERPLRAARPLSDHQPVRRGEHTRALGLRANTRDRDAASCGDDS